MARGGAGAWAKARARECSRALLDRVSNAGTTPQRPSPFGLPFFGCRALLPKPVKTTEGIARFRRLARQPNPKQRHPPFSVNRPSEKFVRKGWFGFGLVHIRNMISFYREDLFRTIEPL